MLSASFHVVVGHLCVFGEMSVRASCPSLNCFVACRISLYVLILIPYQICGWQMFSAVYTELKIMTSSLSVFVDCFWCLSSKNPLCFSFALTLTVLLMSDAWVPTPGYSLTLTGCSVTQFNFDTNKTAQTLQAQGLVP